MSTQAKALPAGWSAVLDDIHERLDQAITLASARIDAMPPSSADSLTPGRGQEIAQWGERLARLSTYLEAAEQVVQSVDELLQKEESRLRQQLATCETLRQKAG